MVSTSLPPQLISLIQHVELNQLGWFDNAIRRFILTIIWLADKNLAPSAVSQHLRELFSIQLDAATIQRHADALCASGTLVCLPDGTLKTSEKSLARFRADLDTLRAIESQVKTRFTHVIAELCPSLDADDTWKRFTDHFLFPFVREMGARTYELFSGAAVIPDRSITFAHFLQRYPADIRTPIQQALVTFLDPKDPSLRQYVLRHLNAFFLMEATNLPEDTLKALPHLTGRAPSFTMFLDTNLLFSMLQLHDNPADASAAALLDLVKRLPAAVSVHLYVSPSTLDEARRVITACHQSLRDLRLTPNVADALHRGQLSGIAMKFVQECVRVKRSLNADDYFRPYTTNLLDILRSKGIELYNEPMEKWLLSEKCQVT